MRRRFTITGVERHTPHVKVFRFKPVKEGLPPFKPGQFVSLAFELDGATYGPKPYSVSSSPLMQDGFELTIEKVGVFTTAMFRLEAGAEVDVIGPLGTFTLDDPVPENLVLVAAGTGIAPMMSMLRYAQDSGAKGQVTLFYSCRTGADIIHKDELRHRSERDDFHLIQTLTRELPESPWQGHRGRLDEAVFKTHIKDKPSARCYLCGSLEFTKSMIDALVEAGVPPANIKKEGWG